MKVKTITITSLSGDPPGYGCQISWYENIIFIEGFSANSILKSNGGIVGDIITSVSSCVTNEMILGSNFDDLLAFTNALGKLPRPVVFELIEPDSHTNGIDSIIKSSIALNSLFTYIKSNYFEKKDTDFYVNLINLYIDCELTDDFGLLRVVYDELFRYFSDVYLLQEDKVRDNDYLKLQIKYELKALLIHFQNSNKSHFVNVLEYIARTVNAKHDHITKNISLTDMLSTKNLLFLYSSTVSASKERSSTVHALFKQFLDDRSDTSSIAAIVKYIPTFRTTVEYDLLVNLTSIKKLFNTICYHNFYIHYCIKTSNEKSNDIKMYVFPLDNRHCAAVIPIIDSDKYGTEQSDTSSVAKFDVISEYLIDNHCRQTDPPMELKATPDDSMRTIHSYYFCHHGEAYYGCTYSDWHFVVGATTVETPSNDTQIQGEEEKNDTNDETSVVKTRNAMEMYRALKNKTISIFNNIKSSTSMLHLNQIENESIITPTTTTFESLSTGSSEVECALPEASTRVEVKGFTILTNIPTIMKLKHFVTQNISRIESVLDKGESPNELISLTRQEFGADINKEIHTNDINTKLFRHLDPIILLRLVYACLTESKILVIASSNTAILSLGEYLKHVLFKPLELTFGLYIPTFPSDSDITSYIDMPSSFFIGVSNKASIQKILQIQKFDDTLIIDMDNNCIISDIPVPLDDQVMALSSRIRMALRQEYFTVDHILPIDSCKNSFELLRDAVSAFITPMLKCLDESCIKFNVEDTPLVLVNEEMFHEICCSNNYSKNFSNKVLHSEYVAKYCTLIT